MGLSKALLVAKVTHARTRPVKHAFRYHVYYVCVALSDLPALGTLTLCALNRFNLFSLRATDYRSTDPQGWMRALLAERGITQADGQIVLVTLPRVLGYAFNPVSFWFCLDAQERPRAVLADVSNTFGERHAYLLHHPDHRAMEHDVWFTSEKIFHVSPYIEVSGHYRFRFHYAPERIGVWIDHHDADGLLLSTSLTGTRRALTSAALLYCFVRYPLVTFKVIGLIYFEALRLFLKGVRYRRKPAPPTIGIS